MSRNGNDSALLRLREAPPEIDQAVIKNALITVYGADNNPHYSSDDFDVAKKQLLQLLNYIISLNPDDFTVFKTYRTNVEKNLLRNSSIGDIALTLTTIKKMLEIALPDIKTNPRKIDRATLDGHQVNACLSGAADHIQTIAGQFQNTTFKTKLIHAKKEMIKILAQHFINEHDILRRHEQLQGDEIHIVHGLFNSVALQYGLTLFQDGIIPKFCPEYSDLFRVYIEKQLDFSKIVNQFTISNPVLVGDVEHAAACDFLQSIGADPVSHLYRLFILNEEKLQSKQCIQLEYQWLLYDLLKLNKFIDDYQIKELKDNTRRSISCIKFFEQIAIIEKSPDQNNKGIRLFSQQDRHFIIYNADKLLEFSDGDLSLLPSEMLAFFIESLKKSFRVTLYDAVFVVAATEYDQQLSEILDEFLKSSAGIQDQGLELSTVLLSAVEKGFSATTIVLLRHLAEDACNRLLYSNGKSLLFRAARNGHLAVVQALLAAGADKANNNNGTTPLFTAAFRGHLNVVQALLAAGADKDKANNYGTTPLSTAAKWNHLTVVQALLAAGADKDKATEDGETPLFRAADDGHLAVVQTLLAEGADKDKAKKDGGTPLYIAAQNGHLAVVQTLLAAGADKDKATEGGVTPLFIAAQQGHFAIVEKLLEKIKSKPEFQDNMFPYDMSKGIASPMKASVLALQEQAKKDPIKDNKFRTLLEQKNILDDIIPHFSTLHVAIVFGHVEIVSILKEMMSIEKFDGECAIKIAELEAIFMPNNRDANQARGYAK